MLSLLLPPPFCTRPTWEQLSADSVVHPLRLAFSLNLCRSGMPSRSPLSSRWPACTWHCGGTWQGVWVAGCLVGQPAGLNCLLTLELCPCLNTLYFPEGSNTDRPDASAVHLHDFQRFLLHEQQVREQQVGVAGGSCLESFSPSHHLPSTGHLLSRNCCRLVQWCFGVSNSGMRTASYWSLFKA